MMTTDGHFFYGGGFMWIFWLLIIVGVIYLIMNMTKGNMNQSSHDSPLEILKKRYAQGEIEEDEYERRRKELER